MIQVIVQSKPSAVNTTHHSPQVRWDDTVGGGRQVTWQQQSTCITLHAVVCSSPSASDATYFLLCDLNCFQTSVLRLRHSSLDSPVSCKPLISFSDYKPASVSKPRGWSQHSKPQKTLPGYGLLEIIHAVTSLRSRRHDAWRLSWTIILKGFCLTPAAK